MAKIFSHHVYLLALLISTPLAAMEVEKLDTSESIVLVLDATLIPAFKNAYTDLVNWGSRWGSMKRDRDLGHNAFAIDTLKLCYFTSLLQTKNAILRIHNIVELSGTTSRTYDGRGFRQYYKNMLCIELSGHLERTRHKKIKTLMNGLQVLTGSKAKAYLDDAQRHRSKYCICTAYDSSNQPFINALREAIGEHCDETIAKANEAIKKATEEDSTQAIENMISQ